jgi:hypothetical protein
LGFDLSCGYNNSLLTTGLTISTLNELSSPITELGELILRHHSPQLNPHGLFQTIKTAFQCLRSMTALQALSPNIFAGGTLGDFQPVGVYTFSDGAAET